MHNFQGLGGLPFHFFCLSMLPAFNAHFIKQQRRWLCATKTKHAYATDGMLKGGFMVPK
jgi:hypothetical protein